MQDGDLAPLPNTDTGVGHECGCIAASSVIRMRAHRTDFREAWDAHALARHRNEPIAIEDAEIIPQFVRPWPKGPGLRQLREGLHLRAVFFLERDRSHVRGLR